MTTFVVQAERTERLIVEIDLDVEPHDSSQAIAQAAQVIADEEGWSQVGLNLEVVALINPNEDLFAAPPDPEVSS